MGGTRLGVGSACQAVSQDTGWDPAASGSPRRIWTMITLLARLTDEVKPYSSICTKKSSTARCSQHTNSYNMRRLKDATEKTEIYLLFLKILQGEKL